MLTVRRWYILLVSAISLQSVTWALIALLRGLLVDRTESPVTATAFQIAVVLIGLPVFLVHWLWAQRLAAAEPAERASALRRLYLYASMASFLGPLLASAHDLVAGLLGLALGAAEWRADQFAFDPGRTPVEAATSDLVAIGVLALLWLYHRQVAASDARAASEMGGPAVVRRLYILAFSAVGLIMTAEGATGTLRWLLYQIGPSPLGGQQSLAEAVALLVVGLPVWVIFWGLAQRQFAAGAEEERESILRALYLYAAVFAGALVAVGSAALILAGVLRGLLGLESLGDIRDPLPTIAGAAVVWAYHTAVLRADAAVRREAPGQAALRQLYWYLVAAVGLASLLVGLAGVVSVLIRAAAGTSFGDELREQLAWFSAALIAGLPVWAIPWGAAQRTAAADTPTGAAARRSIARKIYLYLFLFIATMTVLSGLVYIVWRLVSLALGERDTGTLLSDLAHAIAFCLIAAGVWLYHGAALRQDGRLRQREHERRLAATRVAVVDAGDGRFGRALMDGLRRELAGLSLTPVGLTPAAAAAMGASEDPRPLAAQIGEAQVIVGPWWIASPHGTCPALPADVAEAIAASAARKLVVPLPVEGWEWVGVEQAGAEPAAGQALQAVRQVIEGGPARAARPLSGCAIAAIVVAAVILLLALVLPLLR
ncbi:MAG TPA: DUF5671 domain-containing protein [Roseiflexaceae bacterium]|nr:DUF5671 domain-containing protein [Roseiflexaceae bacterium]